MSETQTVAIPEEVTEELTLLRGFRDLVSEGLGYYLGAKAVTAEAREDESVVQARKQANSIRKEIVKSIPTWIENSDIEAYNEKTAELESARNHLKEVMKPYRERRKPLDKAWRYMLKSGSGEPSRKRFVFSRIRLQPSRKP